MTDQLDMSALLREIDGVPVFAWWPVPLHHFGGFWRCGFAWLRRVRRCRRIGFASYYYAALNGGQDDA